MMLLPQILGSSVSYRIAVGPQQGRKAFMIRTIRPLDRPDPALERVAKANANAISANPAAIQRSIPAEQRDFGKKCFPLYAVCFSYT